MISLVQHIEYLMTEHDCVVIPGWGAMIAQYSASCYNPATRRVEKPRRQVTFNADVNHNDGLLAQSLTRREHMSYDQAMQFVHSSVTAFRKQISQEGELSLGRLGYFHKARLGKMEFVPFDNEGACDEFFGLRAVEFSPLAEAETATGAVIHADFSQPDSYRRSWRRVASVAASIIVLLAMGIMLSTPIIVDRHDTQLAGLNLPSVTKPANSLVPAAAQAAREQSEAVQSQPQNNLAEAATAPANAQNGKYFLIIATLNSQRQVQRYMQSHPDMDGRMQVMPIGKKFRVFVARSDNRESLYSLRDALPDGYDDAWVGN